MNSNSETKWNSSKRCQLRLPHETEHGLASYLSHPNQGKPDEFRDEIVKKKKKHLFIQFLNKYACELIFKKRVCMWFTAPNDNTVSKPRIFTNKIKRNATGIC